MKHEAERAAVLLLSLVEGRKRITLYPAAVGDFASCREPRGWCRAGREYLGPIYCHDWRAAALRCQALYYCIHMFLNSFTARLFQQMDRR